LDFLNFIDSNIYILTPVLFIIGMILKATPKIPSWFIPYLLGIIGIVLCIGVKGFNVNAVIQGVLISGLSVYGHQLIKQGIYALNTGDPPADTTTSEKNNKQ